MKRLIKKITALMCMFVMLVPVFVCGTESATSYTYVEFGSYPQTEVVSQESDSGVYGKTWADEGDCIIDKDLYESLKSLSEDKWDANGDTTVAGSKYRRLKADDATGTSSEDSYYNWSSSSETYRYFKYEPIKWRVLEQNGSDYFLLSEMVLDDQKYNTNITGDLTWETSTLRSWLNGYDNTKNAYGTDYSSSNFIDTAFTSEEQSKIRITYLENKDNNKSGTEGGNDTSDKVFILSEAEVYDGSATAYGFASSYDKEDTNRQAKSSTYAKAMGIVSDESGNCFWWLRSPGSYPGLSILVRESGSVFRGGQHANSKSRGVRPALNVSLSGESVTQFGSFTVEGETSLTSLPTGTFATRLYITNVDDSPITVIIAAYTSDGQLFGVQVKEIGNSGHLSFTIDNSSGSIGKLSVFAISDLQTEEPLMPSVTFGEN